MHKLMKKNKYNGKKVKEILEIDGLKVSPKTNFADAEISIKSYFLHEIIFPKNEKTSPKSAKIGIFV